MLNESKPYFSIIITTYNRSELLIECVESVISQSFTDLEILLIDDCSTDNTEFAIKSYFQDKRIRYFKNSFNRERGYSRNLGISFSRGYFLSFLDSDDLMYPNCLKCAYDYILENKDLKIFHNKYDFFNHSTRHRYPIYFKELSNQFKLIAESNFLSCIGVFVSSSISNQLKFSEDPKMIGSEDYMIWLPILADHIVGRINQVNCGVRVHSGRSVNHYIYDNLEYQRLHILNYIMSNEVLALRYGKYLHLINANYFYHNSIHLLKYNRFASISYILRAIYSYPIFIINKRFMVFLRQLITSFILDTKT
jgi:glycosyltransferase involved in cell wall biosynthesis